MLILLPPSEGKTAPSRGRPFDLGGLTSPGLTAPRAEVLDALVALCLDDEAKAAEVLGLGPTQRHEVTRNAGLPRAATGRADHVYSGVLYEALDLSSLTGPAKRRATSSVAVVSALLGLVRPGDRIPAYRLSGDVSLPGIGPLAAHWGRHLDPAVSAAAGGGPVLDLRSTTYAAFWRPGPEVVTRTLTVRVLHEVDGVRRSVSHFNKATKGRLVRALLEDGAAPRRPAAVVEALRDLGWHVEVGPPGRGGTPLDVVVTTL